MDFSIRLWYTKNKIEKEGIKMEEDKEPITSDNFTEYYIEELKKQKEEEEKRKQEEEAKKEEEVQKMFGRVNIKKVNKVNKVINTSLKVIAVQIAIAASILIIIALLFSYGAFRDVIRRTNVDIMEALEGEYQEDFKIISKEVDDKGNGTYVIHPKKNKDIVFTVTKEGGSMTEDYCVQAIKYYKEKYEDQELVKDFVVKDQHQANVIELEINGYADIEQAVNKVYCFKQYIQSQNERINFFTPLSYLKIGEYRSGVTYLFHSLEEVIKMEKYEYLTYLKQKEEDVTKIPEEDLEKWKPKELQILVNGKPIEPLSTWDSETNVTYDVLTGEYTIYLVLFVHHMENTEIIDKKGEGTFLQYRGAQYQIWEKETDISKKKLNYYCTLSQLERAMSITVEYDFEKMTANIIM